jgi:Tol biopolymer transport system component
MPKGGFIMTKSTWRVLALLAIAFVFVSCHQPEKTTGFPILAGPYLGQEAPGLIPMVFAPGVLNNDETGAFCTIFSPAGDEFYFTSYLRDDESAGGLARMKMADGTWTPPEILPFSSDGIDNDLVISADGRTIVFRSWRALPDGRKPDDHSYLWFVERGDDDWGTARPLMCGGEPVRTGYPSLTADNTLYFAHRRDDSFGIFRTQLVDGIYGPPEHIFTALESIATEGDMYVAPDESFMILSLWNHPGNIGSPKGDLYIVFKDADGSWTEEINMGELVNTHCGENCPTISPDGRYFFFNRYCEDTDRGDMYWVDSVIIDSYRPDETSAEPS